MKLSLRGVVGGCAGALAMIGCGYLTAVLTAGGQGRPGGSSFREPDPLDFDDRTGCAQIFDGKTLNGWDGDPAVWRAADGAIVGEYTREQSGRNSYISYQGGPRRGVYKDFDLKLEIKVENGGGSGIQYRSQVGLPWR